MKRRAFLKSAAASAAALFTPVKGFPAVVKLRNPNSLLSHACVGTGNMARSDLDSLRSHKGTHITALCDVDATYLEAAHKVCPDARLYRNWAEMLEKEGAAIDSVNVSTPDHMHAEIILNALNRGLNVYAQKPLCHALEECRAIADLAAQKKAITQLGTQIAAWDCDRLTVHFLRSGVIGEIKHAWIFTTSGGFAAGERKWPLPEDPVPPTLDWKLWLGKTPYRPFAKGVYHPGTWRKWRAFGSSWLGDMGSHLFSPVWIGMDLGTLAPQWVKASVSDDGWNPAMKEQFWPRMCHVTWGFPGVKATGGKPFEMEWFDGPSKEASTLAEFLPPDALQAIAAKTAFKQLPIQGRVIEGSEGWLISHHFGEWPAVVLKNGGTPPAAPTLEKVPTHYHEYLNSCTTGKPTTSSFDWTTRLTDVILLGNVAQLQPGTTLKWDGRKIVKGA